MPTLEPADESFFTTAPVRIAQTFEIPRPAEEVWAEHVSDAPLGWCRGLRGRWTSPRPFGVGTTREVRAPGGLITMRDHFFIWEEGRRHAFYGTWASAPGLRRAAEDTQVDPTGPDSCRLTWRIAVEPTFVGRPGTLLLPLLFRRLFADTRRHFDAR
jgi:hypothetical protein